MIRKILGIFVVVFFVSACSSAPVVPTLSGKKRERINTVVYDEPPFIMVPPAGTDVNLLPPPKAEVKKKPLPVISKPRLKTVDSTSVSKTPVHVVVDKAAKAVDIIERAENTDTAEDFEKVSVNQSPNDNIQKEGIHELPVPMPVEKISVEQATATDAHNETQISAIPVVPEAPVKLSIVKEPVPVSLEEPSDNTDHKATTGADGFDELDLN